MRVGDLVRPARRGGTWRLGVVESIAPDGRTAVRAYVAPPRSYAGTISTYAPGELVVVPLEKARARLATARAEVAAAVQFADQVAEAVEAAERAR
jgi:hypothetical protein